MITGTDWLLIVILKIFFRFINKLPPFRINILTNTETIANTYFSSFHFPVHRVDVLRFKFLFFRPIFVPSSELNATISEVAPPGSLLNLSYPLAYDSDSGPNGKITYSLLTETDYFTIDHNTSQIFVKTKLDYEKQKVHSIKVRAVDNEDKPQASNEAFATVSFVIGLFFQRYSVF